MLRRRNVNLKKIKELDIFYKVPEFYVKQSAVGGTFSIISFFVITYLIYGETHYFFDSKLKFQFKPDVEFDATLKLNIDITVAMPCSRIGADFIDTTNMLEYVDFDPIHEEDTWWELTPDQRGHFETLKHMNSYLSEEYHAIHEVMWKSNKVAFFSDPPKRATTPSYPPNACRIHGSLNIKKVVGNFHIVSGRLLALPQSHIHFTQFMRAQDYNFTHRINKFSFGETSPGIIHPLEGDEKIAEHNMMAYQYFIDVVPTDINLLFHKSKTYQYSVKDYGRVINHSKGLHGLPGIFFHFDISALKVIVTQQRDSITQFLIKLCATVGGIYVTNGLINMIFQSVMEFIVNRWTNHSTPSQPSKSKVSNLINVPPAVNVNI